MTNPAERSTERLAADLAIAQKALANVRDIIDAIPTGSPSVWYEIGRAVGTARMALAESGYVAEGR